MLCLVIVTGMDLVMIGEFLAPLYGYVLEMIQMAWVMAIAAKEGKHSALVLEEARVLELIRRILWSLKGFQHRMGPQLRWGPAVECMPYKTVVNVVASTLWKYSVFLGSPKPLEIGALKLDLHLVSVAATPARSWICEPRKPEEGV